MTEDRTRLTGGGASGAAGASPPPVLIGDILGHTYRVEAFLAKGGMGEVYRARHVAIETEHAIKVILPELSDNPQIIALLNQEAKTLRTVKNDAVVQYDGLMLDEHGRRYLVMEFVDGPSLAKLLEERCLTPAEVRTLRDRLAQGLAAAHRKGVFHRDISPENIILPDGRIENAKIIDFGIAKSTAAGDKTIIGDDFAGKYSYASPEQAGMYGGKVDGRSDIYSLGLVLAGAAIGFGGKLDMGHSLASMIEARQKVPNLAPVPIELRAELAAMLAPRPEQRIQSMDEVVGLDDKKAEAYAAPPPPRKAEEEPSAGRGKALAFGLAALLTAAVLGGGYYGLVLSRGGNQLPPATATQEPTNSPVPASATTEVVERMPDAPPAVDAPTRQVTTSQPPHPEETAAPPAVSAPEASTRLAAVPQLPRPDETAARLRELAQSYRCSSIRTALGTDGDLKLTGFVSSADDLARLRRDFAALAGVRSVDDALAIYAWPHCEVVKLLQASAAPESDALAPRLNFNIPSLVYKAGDTLVVNVTATTAYDGYLYVDYIDNDANVVHLLPAPMHRSNAMKAGQSLTLGAPKTGGRQGERVYEISEPFGPNLVIAISSPTPLLPPRADEVENAKIYLPVLTSALETAARGADGKHVVASHTFINTVPR